MPTCVLKSFVMNDGERYCLLLDEDSGMPLFYPNLYITTQKRNRSLSYSAMESTLGAISVLMKFIEERDIDVNYRFAVGEYLETHVIEAFSDFSQKSYSLNKKPINSKHFNLRESEPLNLVSKHCHYMRLTLVADYLEWLSRVLCRGQITAINTMHVSKMVKELFARRPIKKGLNTLKNKGLDEEQITLLFEIFRPESDLNPFQDKFVSVRNRLMFLMLYHLGVRGGELLNIRIRDIDFSKNHLRVVRRADQKDDPRIDQPRCKTRDRLLPMRDSLVKEIHNYILNIRKQFVRKGQPDYLFITHQNGPYKGQPISKSSYKKVLTVIKSVSPSLFNFTGHSLRHTWNQKFSELMDTMDTPLNEEAQENMRSYLMGWAPGSGTANIYNKRFVRAKATAVSLELQSKIIRLPKGLQNES